MMMPNPEASTTVLRQLEPGGGIVWLSVPLSDQVFAALEDALEARECFVALLDPEPITTKAELLESVALACEFPEYFGHNWDALLDCLSDFSWCDPEPKGVVLVMQNMETLQHCDPKSAKQFLAVVADAIERWQERGGADLWLLLGKPLTPNA